MIAIPDKQPMTLDELLQWEVNQESKYDVVFAPSFLAFRGKTVNCAKGESRKA